MLDEIDPSIPEDPDHEPSQDDEYVVSRMSSLKVLLDEINRYLYQSDASEYQYLEHGVIACGYRVLTKEGDSYGSIRILPLKNDQQVYVSVGLLDYAKRFMQDEDYYDVGEDMP